MSRVGMGEFLNKVSKLKTKKEKIDALRANDSFELRTVLQGAFDPRVIWELPSGTPPFTLNTLVDQEHVFLKEIKKLAYFVKGGAPRLNQVKRETMFVQLLENLAPEDAQLLLAMKDKKLPYKTITEELVREIFPDLLPKGEEE